MPVSIREFAELRRRVEALEAQLKTISTPVRDYVDPAVQTSQTSKPIAKKGDTRKLRK